MARQPPRRPVPWKLVGTDHDDTVLVIRYESGVGEALHHVDVHERPDSVRLGVILEDTLDGMARVSKLVGGATTITLDGPLADRELQHDHSARSTSPRDCRDQVPANWQRRNEKVQHATVIRN